MATRRQALLLAGGALGGCALAWPEDAALARAVEARVQPLVQARQFGGAIVLLRNGRPLVARGWGLANHELGLPFTPETPCDAASLAKNFTAAGIWLLVHERRLTLQQPVQALVPEYPHRDVTVRHLLEHSNGLAPDYGEFDRHFAPGQVRTTAALLTLAGRDQPVPRFEPGSRFEYSDLAYDTLALVIERAGGEDYDTFVRRRFFGPHRLAQAFVRPARLSDWPVPRTRGYRHDGTRWQDDDAYDGEAFVGGSNLILSALDLARWGDAWAQGRVLPPAAQRAGRERARFGGTPSAVDLLGWYGGPEDPARGHNTGLYNGFRAHVHWDRARLEVVAMVSNAGLPPPEGDALQAALVGLLSTPPRLE